jgi:hypothetical protein
MGDEPLLDICYDRIPAGADALEVVSTAPVDGTNPPVRTAVKPEAEDFRLAIVTSKLWRPGGTLRIAFIGGSDVLRAAVLDHARHWLESANVHFEQVNDGQEAEIRTSFALAGNWSSIGTDALTVEKPQPTMNLQLTERSDEAAIRRASLHEFGHVLGCLHEHQSLGADIPWNEQAVFELYKGSPNYWDEATTRRNVIGHYTDLPSQFSVFDPTSIMIYPISKELTLGGYEVPWNTQLSETDRRFISERYPKVQLPDATVPVDGTAVPGRIASPGAVDLFTFMIEASGTYVVETTGLQALTAELFGPEDLTELRAAHAGIGAIGNLRFEEGLSKGPYLLRIRHKDPNAAGRYGLSIRPADSSI